MNWLCRTIVLFAAVTLSACLSSGGGSSSSSGAPADTQSGVYQGLLLSDDGVPFWATVLLDQDGLAIGSLRDGDDRLVGHFQLNISKHPGEGEWYPVDGTNELLTLSAAAQTVDSWEAELSFGTQPAKWKLDSYNPNAEKTDIPGKYRLAIADQPWELLIAGDESFSLTGAGCELNGHWHSESGNAVVQMQLESRTVCSSLPDIEKMLAFVDHEAMEQESVLQLMWLETLQADSAYAFPR